jgi:uncharacterized protein (TIGR02328 family)
MRLWHQELIPYLPDKQLGGQWVEIRMILGTIAKHGKVNHSTVNYVNDHDIYDLYAYALLVAHERHKRGMYCNPDFVMEYLANHACFYFTLAMINKHIIYPEHNDIYLADCLLNLLEKGIDLRKYFTHKEVNNGTV